MFTNSTSYQYEFEVVIENDRGTFLAFVPALPEVRTHGDTVEHALAMATEAIEVSLEYRRANNLPVPSAHSRLIRTVRVPLPTIS